MMSEMPPSTSPAPAAPAPAKRRLPVWLMVVGGLALVCACAVCVGAFLLANSPVGNAAAAGAQIVFTCVDRNNGDTELCSAWAREVNGTSEFNSCIVELMEDENLTGEAMYDCLVDKGVGP